MPGGDTKDFNCGALMERVLAALTILVVLSFVGAIVVAHARFATVERNIDGILQDTMPSVEQLSTARGELQRLSLSVDECVGPDAASLGAREAVQRQERALADALAAYDRLPFFVEERPLHDELPRAHDDVVAQVEAVVGAAARGDTPAAQRAIVIGHSRIAALDDLIERLIVVNANKGRELGLDAQSARIDALRLVAIWDAAAVALAVAATALAIVILRRSVLELERDKNEASRRASTLEARSAELDQFAGRVAHDVLSPLAAIGYSLEVARKRAGEEGPGARALTRGITSLERVRRLVDGLLEYARAGAHVETGASSSLAAVIADVVEAARAEATAQRIRIGVEPFADARVACSDGVLMSLLSNVLNNAIKHMGDARERRIDVRVLERGDRRRIEVSDTGEGVPPELRDILFEPFVHSGRKPGVGLGLATVQRLARGHGGDAGYRANEPCGSTFWFELPLAAPHAPPMSEPEPCAS